MAQSYRQAARGSGDGVRLFCFPHAGGNSSMFKDWGRHLPAYLKVHGVALPGRLGRFREPLLDRLERLVPLLVRELKALLSPPVALFGHSLGALIAFEFAREMRREGLPAPLHLFASSYPAPQLPRAGVLLHQLSDQLLLQKTSHLLPREALADREWLRAILSILRADCALSETYRYVPEPPLDCPITALGGMWDVGVGRAELKMWREQTGADFNLHLFPGDHDYLRAEPARLLFVIRKTLEERV